MWTKLDQALEKYPSRKEHLLSSNYSLAWSPADKKDAKKNLSHRVSDIKIIFANTPSIGQYWPTQGAFKYLSKPCEILVKCGDEQRISNEASNMKMMREIKLPVPLLYDLFETPNEIYEDEKFAFPKILKGKILVEEFIHSISLGHALVDRRIDVYAMSEMIIETLVPLHKIAIHGELKHQHIRICLSKEDATNLIRYNPDGENNDVLSIKGICFIDLETFKENRHIEQNKFVDLIYLRETIIKYYNALDNLDSNLLNQLTLLSKSERYQRMNIFLEILKKKYCPALSIEI